MKKPLHFRHAFLHPRYFSLWLGISLLYLLVQMPYRWLCALGRFLGLCAMRLMARRVSIARQNLTLCFPQKTPEQIEYIVRENFKSLGSRCLSSASPGFGLIAASAAGLMSPVWSICSQHGRKEKEYWPSASTSCRSTSEGGSWGCVIP